MAAVVKFEVVGDGIGTAMAAVGVVTLGVELSIAAEGIVMVVRRGSAATVIAVTFLLVDPPATAELGVLVEAPAIAAVIHVGEIDRVAAAKVSRFHSLSVATTIVKRFGEEGLSTAVAGVRIVMAPATI